MHGDPNSFADPTGRSIAGFGLGTALAIVAVGSAIGGTLGATTFRYAGRDPYYGAAVGGAGGLALSIAVVSRCPELMKRTIIEAGATSIAATTIGILLDVLTGQQRSAWYHSSQFVEGFSWGAVYGLVSDPDLWFSNPSGSGCGTTIDTIFYNMVAALVQTAVTGFSGVVPLIDTAITFQMNPPGSQARSQAKDRLKRWGKDAASALVSGFLAVVATPVFDGTIGRLPGFRALPGNAKTEAIDELAIVLGKIVAKQPILSVSALVDEVTDAAVDAMFSD